MRVMYEKSPIAHVKKVKTPVMLNIGKVDLRVPPSQGYEYYHALKALGKYVEARNVYISGLVRLNAESGVWTMKGPFLAFNMAGTFSVSQSHSFHQIITKTFSKLCTLQLQLQYENHAQLRIPSPLNRCMSTTTTTPWPRCR